ncbi:MAG: Zn-dependent oligopeptidase [Chloroflexi bacterium]|nr:Zn-dependent oligopeptidase [Chloroflexota bacterium]
MLDFPVIWKSATEIESSTNDHLSRAESIRNNILEGKGQHNLENTLVPYNNMLIEIDLFMNVASLLSIVHPDDSIIKAAESSYEKGMQFLNNIKLDRGLYKALTEVDSSKLDSEAARFLSLLLRDYHRSGIDKDDATMAKLSTIYQEMISTAQEFSRNIREDHRYIELLPGDMAGMPEDFIKAHSPGENGKIKISTDYSDYYPFLTYQPREDLRKQLYYEFQRRAYPVNDPVLKKLLNLRYQYAVILGYKDWADYYAEDKMVKTKDTINSFIDRVANMAQPEMNDDLTVLLARKKLDIPQADVIYDWDYMYYLQKLRSEQYGVDSQQVRQYFEYTRTKDGILNLIQEIFDIKFIKINDHDVWYPDVETYNVLDHGQTIGRFYLDMYPRDKKYSHMATAQMVTGLKGRQPALVALVCNFPKATANGEPALLEHNDVITMFHELGHMMHHLLSYKHKWVTLSGFNCEWDFVEVPSQLLEEWGWDTSILQRFAVNYRTNEPIPANLVRKMKKAAEFGKGIYVMRQLSYAKLSLTYYNQDPWVISLIDTWKQVQIAYSP